MLYDGADFPDQKCAVRGVGEAHGDHALLPAVRQEDGFRGLDDGVAIGGVHLLQHIGAGFEARPDGGPVLAGDLRADGGPARAAGPAQIFQLEGAAGEGLAGDGVIFFHHDPIVDQRPRTVPAGDGRRTADAAGDRKSVV